MKFEWTRGRYLFHLHTPLTDGHLTIEDYVTFAGAERIDSVIFLEHIRSVPSYDPLGFIRAVKAAPWPEGCQPHAGFEAKILPEGRLDIPAAAAAEAEVIGAAEHGFPDDEAGLVRAFESIVAGPYRERLVWVHPGWYFVKRGKEPATQPAYVELCRLARAAGVPLEWNLRYQLPRATSPESASVIGADAHRIEDLERWRARFH